MALSHHTKALVVEILPEEMRLEYLTLTNPEVWKAMHALTLVNGADPVSISHDLKSSVYEQCASTKENIARHRTKHTAICAALPPWRISRLGFAQGHRRTNLQRVSTDRRDHRAPLRIACQ